MAKGPPVSSSGAALHNFDASSPLRFHFGSGVWAFGADFSSQASPYFSSFTATLSLDNGESFSFTGPTSPDYTFFGFISDIAIRNMTFSDGGTAFGYHEELIRDIVMVAVIPEPASVALIALAAVVLACRTMRGRPSHQQEP